MVLEPTVLPLDELWVDESICLVEEPKEILEHDTKNLHKKKVKLMKAL